MLGSGAFSTCYQARDFLTGTLMAVKQIQLNLDDDEKVVKKALLTKTFYATIVRALKGPENASECRLLQIIQEKLSGRQGFLNFFQEGPTYF